MNVHLVGWLVVLFVLLPSVCFVSITALTLLVHVYHDFKRGYMYDAKVGLLLSFFIVFVGLGTLCFCLKMISRVL